jgi:hypothetical protein
MIQYTWDDDCPKCGNTEMECWSECYEEGPGCRCLECGYYRYFSLHTGQLSVEEVNDFPERLSEDLGEDGQPPPYPPLVQLKQWKKAVAESN